MKHQKTKAETLSFAEAKKLAIANPLLRQLVRLGDLTIADVGHVKYNGSLLNFTPEAFAKFVRLLGVPTAFQHKVEILLGVEAKLELLNSMKTTIAANKNKVIALIGNPSTAQIVGVASQESMLSHEGFFELAESLVDRHNLEIKACSIGRFGEVVINAIAPLTAKIKGLEDSYKTDESYKPGLSFSNSIFEGTVMSSFTERLVCDNGMTAPCKTDISIGGFDSKEIKKFYEKIAGFARSGFQSFGYNEAVLKAVKTHASVGEVEFAVRTMGNNTDRGHQAIESFLNMGDIRAKFAKVNVHVEAMNKEQKINAATPYKVWDVVNAMTDYATHAYDGIELSPASRAEVQRKAGALLMKSRFDTQNLVPSILAM